MQKKEASQPEFLEGKYKRGEQNLRIKTKGKKDEGRESGIRLAPHIGRVPLLGFHLFDVLYSFTLAHVALALQHLEQNVSHIGGHIFGVTGVSGRKF